jgi:hypothetical protein
MRAEMEEQLIRHTLLEEEAVPVKLQQIPL